MSDSMLTSLGKVFLHASSSPYLRSAPLIFLFLSSSTFVVGFILTWQKLRYFCVRCQRQPPFQNLADSDLNDIVEKVKAALLSGKQTLGQCLKKSVEFVDNMVADDLLRKIVKTGNEVVAGVAGGIVLYSLPEDIFPHMTPDALSSCKEINVLTHTSQVKSTRRRVIHALDPSLDDILFRPGGIWNLTPAGFRDTLISLNRSSTVEGSGSFVCDAPTLDSTANESGSREEEKFVTRHGSPPTLIHICRSQQIDATVTLPGDSSEKDKPEEVTQNDANTSPQNNDKLINKDVNHHRESHTPPSSHFEKVLQRTAIAASLCFVLHLHTSPSTQKTWRSAMNLFASCGLLSTAICTGLASKLLSSTLMQIAPYELTVCGAICFNTLERMISFQSVRAKIRGLVKRVTEKVKTNK